MKMQDFDYLARESNAAWLDGRGDGRFDRYEQFYRSEWDQTADQFDLEKVNEAYLDWSAARPSRLLSALSAPWFGRVAIALFSLCMGCRLVPGFAKAMPEATGLALVVAFVGLRIFHRRRKRH
ncbi:hypothetical protein AB6809_32625 [Paraburkholderia sp. RCC_158]|uniref:hypothetical protein n=1 Tax=Paraburkholderia sp. RCC_158 TaxID=3239220 RepID=UPI003523D06C